MTWADLTAWLTQPRLSVLPHAHSLILRVTNSQVSALHADCVEVGVLLQADARRASIHTPLHPVVGERSSNSGAVLAGR
jgi:hypothetical protein